MNRRVVVTVIDDQGRTVSAAGVGEAIRPWSRPSPGMTDCCSEVLSRLDKLDDIAKILKDLADQNADLRRQLDALKQAQQVLESKANQPPAVRPPRRLVPWPPAPLPKQTAPKFQAMGVNVGQDSNGNTPRPARAAFRPFRRSLRVPGAGRISVLQGREGRPVGPRFGGPHRPFPGRPVRQLQDVALSGNQNGGTLGQAALTLDYIFKYGQSGVRDLRVPEQRRDQQRGGVLANGVTWPDLFTQRFPAGGESGGRQLVVRPVGQ